MSLNPLPAEHDDRTLPRQHPANASFAFSCLTSTMAESFIPPRSHSVAIAAESHIR